MVLCCALSVICRLMNSVLATRGLLACLLQKERVQLVPGSSLQEVRLTASTGAHWITSNAQMNYLLDRIVVEEASS